MLHPQNIHFLIYLHIRIVDLKVKDLCPKQLLLDLVYPLIHASYVSLGGKK